jgi:hypothetical protein
VEPIEVAQLEAERSVQHDGWWRQAHLGEGLPRGGEATARGYEERDVAALELGDGGQYLRSHLEVVVPERAVEVGDDELDG